MVCSSCPSSALLIVPMACVLPGRVFLRDAGDRRWRRLTGHGQGTFAQECAGERGPFRILAGNRGSRVKPRPSMAGSNRVNGWHVSAPDGSLVALLDEGVPVRAHTPLPADTPRPGAAATARDGRLESEPGPHQRCILPISLGRLPAHLTPPLLTARDAGFSGSRRLNSIPHEL